jgi:hypothetical protein
MSGNLWASFSSQLGVCRMTDDTITLVTVTIVDADSTTACYSSYLSEYETLDGLIEQVKSDAMDAFNGEGGTLPYRAVVNVNVVPKPVLVATIVKADVPQGEADAVVTATVA